MRYWILITGVLKKGVANLAVRCEIGFPHVESESQVLSVDFRPRAQLLVRQLLAHALTIRIQGFSEPLRLCCLQRVRQLILHRVIWPPLGLTRFFKGGIPSLLMKMAGRFEMLNPLRWAMLFKRVFLGAWFAPRPPIRFLIHPQTIESKVHL
jgi:hypothetical protein